MYQGYSLVYRYLLLFLVMRQILLKPANSSYYDTKVEPIYMNKQKSDVIDDALSIMLYVTPFSSLGTSSK